MGAYSKAAIVYDLLYEDKDYDAEADALADLIHDRNPEARHLLDVACGTGRHAQALAALGFNVLGIDVEPQFLKIAAARCPQALFQAGDMERLKLKQRFDVITCLFSSIGYVQTDRRLRRTIARLAAHLVPGGLLIVDPWFEPGELTHGRVLIRSGSAGGVSACRMQRTLVKRATSLLEFQYLIGGARGMDWRRELHRLGLFTQRQMEDAFAAAGLDVERLEPQPGTRGLYVGTRP